MKVICFSHYDVSLITFLGTKLNVESTLPSASRKSKKRTELFSSRSRGFKGLNQPATLQVLCIVDATLTKHDFKWYPSEICLSSFCVCKREIKGGYFNALCILHGANPFARWWKTGRKMEEPRGIQGCLPLEHLDNLIWLLLRFAMDNLMPCTLLHSLNILEMI